MEVELMPHQDDFFNSEATHTGLIGGFGCGKSFVGILKTVVKKLKYKGVDVAYYLPTYPLIRDIAFPKFSEILEEMGVGFSLNRTEKEFQTDYGRIILRSMDNPNLIVGYEVGYSLIDEADILSKSKMSDAFVKIVARNRKPLPNGDNNCTDFVSTPEGFKFLYHFFSKNDNKNRVLIKGRTESNKHLPKNYIETLREIYTEQQLEAYLNGEFVNLTSGNVFHTFNRKINHSNREIKSSDVLHIGMDFNITNMSAAIRVTDGKNSTAIGEITKAYDTADMIRILKARYPKHRMVVYPDASGNARNTAGDSDIKLLRKSRLTVRVGSKNPSVRDRITTVNASFKNANNETTNFINTNNCPELTEAYERLPYKNGVSDKDSGFDHITDADGYCVYNIKTTSSSTTINAG